MCAKVIVTAMDAKDLVTGPGNPHLIWDGAEARVITGDFYRAMHAESAWLLIMSREMLSDLDPAPFDPVPENHHDHHRPAHHGHGPARQRRAAPPGRRLPGRAPQRMHAGRD